MSYCGLCMSLPCAPPEMKCRYPAESDFPYHSSRFRRGCAWGTMDTLPEIPGIALRFDGHVGVYIGGGYAVEERGFNYGCVKNDGFFPEVDALGAAALVDYGDAVFAGGSAAKPDTPASEYTMRPIAC